MITVLIKIIVIKTSIERLVHECRECTYMYGDMQD